MKVLMLTTKYSLQESSPYLTDELAREIGRSGHEIHVLWVNWDHSKKVYEERKKINSLIVHEVPAVQINFGPYKLRRLVRWLITPWRVAIHAYKIKKLINPDVFVAYSPLVALWLPVWLLTRQCKSRRYLIQWDFFPDAQQQDGSIRSNFVVLILRRLENWLMNRFSIIGCMSPRNVDYLKYNYNINENINVEVLPIWTSLPSYNEGSREAVRAKYGLPINKLIFIFGGQFVAGRGIEDILAAAEMCSEKGKDFCFLFIGQGPFVNYINSAILKKNCDIRLLNNIPRNEYLTLLSVCDVGIASTLRVAVPTFPSKSLDYIQVGIPVLASVDPRTDFGDFIENNKIGIQVPAGDSVEFSKGMFLIDEILKNDSRKNQFSKANFSSVIDKYFSVKNTADSVIGIKLNNGRL